jgi:hypothetical protein
MPAILEIPYGLLESTTKLLVRQCSSQFLSPKMNKNHCSMLPKGNMLSAAEFLVYLGQKFAPGNIATDVLC